MPNMDESRCFNTGSLIPNMKNATEIRIKIKGKKM
jgi:hypothetical protein